MFKDKRDQIEELMTHITAGNYIAMKRRFAARSSVDEEKNSSNFDQLANNLESVDNNWIDRINRILDE